MSKIISLDQKLNRLKINQFEIDNEIIFKYFNNLPMEQRDDYIFKAIYIGVLALMEDRLAAFLSKTQNQLGTELESLKMIFEMKKEIFFKTTVKGMLAEDELADYLNDYFKNHNMKDEAVLTGNQAGKISKNKTGDIICLLDGKEDKKIAIEVKFDKSIKLGDVADKDIFVKKQDTAWSQIIEARANRGGKIGIIVFDLSLVDNSILKFTESVGFIDDLGFVVIVDSQKGDYSNLIIAYNLARDITINAKEIKFNSKTLSIILKRIIKDIDVFFTIKRLIESNIENNREVLKQLEKALLLMEFNQKYLSKFLIDGKLNDEDILDFYSGEEIRDKYKLIAEEIDKI